MIELSHDELVFRFPEVHADAECRITFQRTLRIPDDNRDYPLPPGLGAFPLRHVDDHLDTTPAAWGRHGGVFLPMYQAEAMWLNFNTAYPMAIKVAAGKIDAVTGEPWTNDLSEQPQNYLAVPDQPWLDGFCVEKGLIRQFVAMPLGEGYTAEEQLTGEARHGGLQIVVYPMQAPRYLACTISPCRYGAGAGRAHAPGDLWGRVRLRFVGPVGPRPLLRSHSQQRAVPSGVRVRAAGDAAHGPRLRRGRAALVRLLRRRPDCTRRREKTGGPGQCGRNESEEGRGCSRRQRTRAADRRQATVGRTGSRG